VTEANAPEAQHRVLRAKCRPPACMHTPVPAHGSPAASARLSSGHMVALKRAYGGSQAGMAVLPHCSSHQARRGATWRQLRPGTAGWRASKAPSRQCTGSSRCARGGACFVLWPVSAMGQDQFVKVPCSTQALKVPSAVSLALHAQQHLVRPSRASVGWFPCGPAAPLMRPPNVPAKAPEARGRNGVGM